MDNSSQKAPTKMENKEGNAGKKPNNEIPIHMRPVLMDRELLVWEKWVQIRKDETIKLGRRVNRPPVDLAMNLGDKVREDRERKTALELAQLKKKPKLRGHLFEQPCRLKQHDYCDPVYEIQRTPAELGRPSVIEHISVPTRIKQTELGMSGEPQRKDCQHLNAEYIKYRNRREKDLIGKIRKIDPFRPSTSKLMIEGFQPRTPPPKNPPPPSLVIDSVGNKSEDLCGIYAVRINNTVLFKENLGKPISLPKFENKKWNEKCISWTYYFNVPVKRLGRGKLFMQNLGTVSLRYCWKTVKRPLPLIPGAPYDAVFFFNKNEDVLSPGQSTEICFTFVSDQPGIYSEFWELTFSNVCFFDTINEKLTVDLYADSVENAEGMKRKIEVLKTRIHRKSLNNLASDFVNEIFDCVFAKVPQTYPYKKYFLEAELFVMKNPVCFYHQTDVAELHALYEQMAPGQTWDLSIGSWRAVMMSKEYEERMKYFSDLKRGHSNCLKPWYEGGELLQQKYRAMNDLWGQLANNLDREYERICDLYAPKSDQIDELHSKTDIPDEIVDPFTLQLVRNVFYLHAYDHVAIAIEQCAGVLSSLDSDKWIEFDFCRT